MPKISSNHILTQGTSEQLEEYLFRLKLYIERDTGYIKRMAVFNKHSAVPVEYAAYALCATTLSYSDAQYDNGTISCRYEYHYTSLARCEIGGEYVGYTCLAVLLADTKRQSVAIIDLVL